MNLPVHIQFGSKGGIDYVYDAAGIKWSKQVADSSKQVKTEYIGGFQYKAGKLLFFPTAEGYVKAVYGDTGNSPAAYRYVYTYKDHLGNNRLSYTLNPVTNKVDILEENNYYPFGLTHPYNSTKRELKFDTAGNLQIMQVTEKEMSFKYKYNGKELQDELNLGAYDFGARFYYPDVPFFWSIDPKAEKYSFQSPYVYAVNNPIRFIDKDGMEPYCCDGLKGFLVGTVDNMFGTNFRQSVSVSDVEEFNAGLDVADAVALIGGGAMTVNGAIDMTAGTGALVASAEVTAGTGGLSVEVTGPTAGMGVVLLAKGASEVYVGNKLMSNAARNFSNRRNESSSNGRPRSTKHTDNRHINRKKYPNKSKYKNPAQRKKLETRTMKTKGVKQKDGRIRYDKNYGRVIGTKGETSHRVIVDPKKNKIVTSFPQNQ